MLIAYREQSRLQEEPERDAPSASKEKPKTFEPNRQTVHQQPKTKKKSREVIYYDKQLHIEIDFQYITGVFRYAKK